MSISDVLLQNLMPKNFLDSSDDETEAWTTSSGSSGHSTESGDGLAQTKSKSQTNFDVFEDYFGLSNLLQNVKIAQDNPFLYPSHFSRGGDVFYRRNRRLSWESDTSDPNAVISPTLDVAPYSYSGLIGDFGNPAAGTAQQDGTRTHHQHHSYEGGNSSYSKQLPPPSMRLSKAMRDQIINGSYHQPYSSSHGHQQQPQLVGRREEPNTGLHQSAYPMGLQHRSADASQVVGNQVAAGPLGPLAGMHHGGGRAVQPQQQVCVFCRNNGESEAVYSSHVLKDSEGRTACPILRAYTCPICKANGDSSHTIKYCPLNQHSNTLNNNNSSRSNSTSGSLPMPPQQHQNGMPVPPTHLHQQHMQQQHMSAIAHPVASTCGGAALMRNSNCTVAAANRVVRPPFAASAMAQRMKPR